MKKIILILAVFLMVSANAFAYTDTAFFDDFSDGDASDWTPYSSYPEEWKIINFEGNNVYFGDGYPSEYRAGSLNNSINDYDNYILSSNMYILDDTGGSLHGIVGKATDENNRYVFGLQVKNGGSYQFIKYVNGQSTMLGYGVGFGFIEGEWYNIAMQFQDGWIGCFVNGVLIAEANDSELNGPYIGVHTHGGKTYFDDVAITFDLTLEAKVDVKPGSCLNPFNMMSKGVLPVAILGTDEIDVSTIDVSSVELEGLPPIRFVLEDVAGLDGCEGGPDGIADLVLHFDSQLIADTFAGAEDGEILTLGLSALTLDGYALVGQDKVLVIKKGKK